MIRRDRVHGGGASEGEIDFSISINPLGPPPCALKAYGSAAARIAVYPEPYPRKLEAAVAKWLGVPSDFVLAGNGSTQLIYLTARVFRPRLPAVVIPTFSEIANSLIVGGSAPFAIATSRENEFNLDRDAVVEALRSGADAVFIGRPNSPTGSMLDIDDAGAIAAECARYGAWCVFDEAFIEFVRGGRSCVEFVRANPRVLVLRSLTKIFAIPGLRLGYLVANPNTLNRVREAIEPWSVNSIADCVAQACLEVANDFIRETCDYVVKETVRLREALASTSVVHAYPSAANFLLLEVPSERYPDEFQSALMSSGIKVRNLRELPGCSTGTYRVGIRKTADNNLLADAARAWCSLR